MLYRFREAQAAELGLGTRGDKRLKMASACKACVNVSAGEQKSYARSVERCPRSRTVRFPLISPFAHSNMCVTAGLTDYEVRDLNDEINKLLREKRH